MMWDIFLLWFLKPFAELLGWLVLALVAFFLIFLCIFITEFLDSRFGFSRTAKRLDPMIVQILDRRRDYTTKEPQWYNGPSMYASISTSGWGNLRSDHFDLAVSRLKRQGKILENNNHELRIAS